MITPGRRKWRMGTTWKRGKNRTQKRVRRFVVLSYQDLPCKHIFCFNISWLCFASRDLHVVKWRHHLKLSRARARTHTFPPLSLSLSLPPLYVSSRGHAFVTFCVLLARNVQVNQQLRERGSVCFLTHPSVLSQKWLYWFRWNLVIGQSYARGYPSNPISVHICSHSAWNSVLSSRHQANLEPLTTDLRFEWMDLYLFALYTCGVRFS